MVSRRRQKDANKSSRPQRKKRESWQIDLQQGFAYSRLSEYQEQIARAKREGQEEIVIDIANQLVFSYQARVLAVHKVASNKGARTHGVSGNVTLNCNEDYRNMIDRLERIVKNPTEYRATPLGRFYITKPSGGLRPISIPSYTDRCLQTLYRFAIEPIIEEVSDKSSYGFRPIRNPKWGAARVHGMLVNPITKYKYALEVDIKGCYDNIDHEFLMKYTPYIPRHILLQWLKCGYITRDSEHQGVSETKFGVPHN